MRDRIWIVLAAFVALAGLGAVGWWVYEHTRGDALPEGIVAASGRLEARDTRVASASGGRVMRLLVQEGDPVEQGAVLVELDRRALEAGVSGAEATLAAALENVHATEERIAALESQLALARLEAGRFQRLFSRDAAPRQAVDRAEATHLQLDNEVRAARAGLELARRQADAAGAQLRAATVQLGETTVVAPVAGFVETAFVRPGEVAAPGMPLLRLTHADEVTLRVYLPISTAQQLQPGMESRAYVEGFGDRPFAGVIERIAREAEFTPRDVHMPDDRTTLVYAVTLRIPNPDGVLNDGFPADVFIRGDPAAPWPDHLPWQ